MAWPQNRSVPIPFFKTITQIHFIITEDHPKRERIDKHVNEKNKYERTNLRSEAPRMTW